MLVQATLLEWVKRIGVCRACAGSAEKLLKVLASGFTRLLPLKSCIDPKKRPIMPDTWKYDEDYRKEMAEAPCQHCSCHCRGGWGHSFCTGQLGTGEVLGAPICVLEEL